MIREELEMQTKTEYQDKEHLIEHAKMLNNKVINMYHSFKIIADILNKKCSDVELHKIKEIAIRQIASIELSILERN